MINLELLKRYCSATGVSGFEENVTDLFFRETSGCTNVQETDPLGNAYAWLSSCNDSSPIMIEAHCDEIGFQVIHISESGLLYVRRNGGVDEQCLPGSIVTVQTAGGGYIEGVIGKKPIHLMSQDDRLRTAEIHQLWVDTGLAPETVKQEVSIGAPVALSPNFRKLGSRIVSKALDNRVGLFVISEVLKNLYGKSLNRSVCAVATTQEELGSRGAVVAAYKCRPKVAITVDLDFATDLPDMNANRYGNTCLGKGVVLPFNADISPNIFKKMVDICESKGISFQKSARPHSTGGTNVSRIQLSRDGIETMSLGIPCRYMHTPVEMCDIEDIKSAILLLTKFYYEYTNELG